MSIHSSPIAVVATPEPVPPPSEDLALMSSGKGSGATADVVLRVLTAGAALVILVMLAGLIAVLTRAAMPSIKQYSMDFVTSTQWRPNEIERPVRDANGKLVLDADGERV